MGLAGFRAAQRRPGRGAGNAGQAERGGGGVPDGGYDLR